MADIVQDQDLLYGLKNWQTGLHSNIPYFDAQPNSLLVASNAMVNKKGALTRRFSFSEIGMFDETVSGFPFALLWVGPTATYAKRALWLVFGDGNNAYAKTYDGTSWGLSTVVHMITQSIVKNGAAWVRESGGTEYVYVVATDSNTHKYTIAQNPVGTIIDGTVNTNAPANCNFLVNFYNRLWAAGKFDQHRDKLFYSNLGTPETWDQANNWISFGGQHGERITAIHPYRENQIVVGTDLAIYLLAIGTQANLSDAQVILITRDYGIMSNWTVCNTGEDLMFMDSYGEIRSLQRTIQDNVAGVRSLPVSFRIRDKLTAVSQSALTLSTAVYFDNVYHLQLAYGFRERLYFCYDKTQDIWYGPWNFLDQAGATLWPNLGAVIPSLTTTFGANGLTLNNTQKLHFVGRRDADNKLFLMKVDALTNVSISDTLPSATAKIISSEIQTQPLDFQYPYADKLIKWFEMDLVQETLTTGTTRTFLFYGSVDLGVTWTLLSTVNYQPGGTEPYIKIKIDCKALSRAKVFQFRIVKSDTGPPFQIYRATIMLHIYETRDN